MPASSSLTTATQSETSPSSSTSSSSNADQSDKKKTNKIAATVGGIVAAFSVLFVALLALGCALRRRARKQNPPRARIPPSVGSTSYSFSERIASFQPVRNAHTLQVDPLVLSRSPVPALPVAQMMSNKSRDSGATSNLMVVNVTPEPRIPRRPVHYDYDWDPRPSGSEEQPRRDTMEEGSPFTDMLEVRPPRRNVRESNSQNTLISQGLTKPSRRQMSPDSR